MAVMLDNQPENHTAANELNVDLRTKRNGAQCANVASAQEIHLFLESYECVYILTYTCYINMHHANQ